MLNGQREDRQALDVDGLTRGKEPEVEARPGGFSVPFPKEVRKRRFNRGGRRLVSPYRDLSFPRKGPKVVEAQDVVGVGVSEQHRFEEPKTNVEGLGTKIGAGVNQPAPVARREEDRCPAAMVPGVAGPANGARAAYHRNARRGSSAEKRHLHGVCLWDPRLFNEFWNR